MRVMIRAPTVNKGSKNKGPRSKVQDPSGKFQAAKAPRDLVPKEL